MFKNIWNFNLMYIVLLACLAVQTVLLFFFNLYFFIGSGVVFLILFFIILFRFILARDKVNKLIKSVNEDLQTASSNALSNFNMPLIVVSDRNEIVWYNQAFSFYITDTPDELVGKDVSEIISEENQELLRGSHKVEISYGDKIFRVFESYSDSSDSKETNQRILCFVDVTSLKKAALEYSLSRPVVALLAVDNFDEVARNMRDSERSAVSSKIQNVLENWFATTNGISRRLGGDRFMFVFEERHLKKFKLEKFGILHDVRSIDFGGRGNATISIGIGSGGSGLRECEELAAQALDMALGRGGDQVAIKLADNSYQFFGGLSNASEKRTRVRTRIVASALVELIESSDRIILMGHRFSDLDCFGSAFALWSAIEKMGKETHIVMDKMTSMSLPLLSRIEDLGNMVKITDAAQLIPLIGKGTLVIVLDTHRPQFVDNPEILGLASTVVVIDHHRKAVDYIEKAVIFYHETAASSTCEMVSELLQYINENSIGRAEAEALLSGIMLDTKNFVFNTGVRTFEASAFLRRRGADPVAVKELFADSIDSYKQKSNVIATSEVYKDAAIAINASTEPGVKMVTSQAADELLNIKGVRSSFVLCRIDNGINISARSFGERNVQIVMEKLGGGGHRTMAACQLDVTDFDIAKKMLISAIDETEEG